MSLARAETGASVYTVNGTIAGKRKTLAMFSTREKAEAFIAAHRESNPDRADRMEVEEFVLDEPDDWVRPVKPVPIADIMALRESLRSASIGAWIPGPPGSPHIYNAPEVRLRIREGVRPRPVVHRPIVKNADKYCRTCGANFVWDDLERRFYWDCNCDPIAEGKW
jgi:hypothetical protein